MKKSLIALAVLAASGAALAQSNVTIYGVADVWLGTVDTGVSQSQINDGGVAGSRLGFKGSEDLGGGLKANFVLEQGLDLPSGAATGFSRESSVGLSGGFGAVKIGRFTTAYDDVSGAATHGFDSELAAANYIWASVGYTARPNQGIRYDFPDMGAFSGAVSYSMDTIAGAGSDSVTSVSFKYTDGPVMVGFGYQDENATDTQFTRLNGTYDFGAFKVLAGYGRVDAAGVKSTDYSLGADVPLASNFVLSAGYASSKTAGVKTDGWNVVGAYVLSKRTTVYGGYVSTDGALDKAYAVGINHSF